MIKPNLRNVMTDLKGRSGNRSLSPNERWSRNPRRLRGNIRHAPATEVPLSDDSSDISEKDFEAVFGEIKVLPTLLDELKVSAQDDSLEYCFLSFLSASSKTKKSKGRRSSLHEAVSNSYTSKLEDEDRRRKTTQEINAQYTEELLSLSEKGFEGVALNLHAADRILCDFYKVSRQLSDSDLPADLPQRIFRVIEDFIKPHLNNYYGTDAAMKNLTVHDSAMIISWINNFLTQLKEACPSIEASASWKVDEARMLEHYLQFGVRNSLEETIGRFLKMEDDDDLRLTSRKRMVSGQPEAITFLVNSQMATAKEMLPEMYWEVVWATCTEELSVMVGEIMMHVVTSWQRTGAARFCAIVNDASRLTDLMEDRNSLYLRSAKYEEAGYDMVRDLAELGMHATQYLCERIKYDLCDPASPILTKVGDADWEADQEGTAMGRTIATLHDFFLDLEGWLPKGYYFPKVLKFCFDNILKTYVESFFANTMKKGRRDAETVAQCLDQDYLRLQGFFKDKRFKYYFGVAGFYTKENIAERLRFVQNMCRIVNPYFEPEDLLDDIIPILQQFENGHDGTPAVLHLAGLRKKQSAEESVEWFKVIAKAEQAVTEMEKDLYYHLPDLRNSCHLCNIQKVSNKQMERRISANSINLALSTSEFVQTSHRKLPAGLRDMLPTIFAES